MDFQAGGFRVRGETTILDEIAGRTKLRVAKAKNTAPFELVREQALSLAETHRAGSPLPFERALALPGISFIRKSGLIPRGLPRLR